MPEKNQHPDHDHQFAHEEWRTRYVNPGERAIEENIPHQDGEEKCLEYPNTLGLVGGLFRFQFVRRESPYTGAGHSARRRTVSTARGEERSHDRAEESQDRTCDNKEPTGIGVGEDSEQERRPFAHHHGRRSSRPVRLQIVEQERTRFCAKIGSPLLCVTQSPADSLA